MKSSFPDLVIPDKSLPELIKERIREFGEDTALVDNTNGRTLTYKELYDQINKLSFALAQIGLKKGDVVVICAANCIEYPIAFLAILSCGATVVTCRLSFTRDKILKEFGNTRPRFLIVENELEKQMKDLTKELSSVEEIFTVYKSSESRSIEGLIKGETVQENFTQVEIDTKEDTAVIVYSSGTTGSPKGIMHTHRSIIAYIEIWRSQAKQFRSNCCLSLVFMYTSYGYQNTFITLMDGAKFIFQKDFDLEDTLCAIEKYKVSHIMGGLLHVTALAKRSPSRKYDTSSLLQIICSGTTISSDLMDEIEKRYGCIVSPTYGLTEIDPLSFSHYLTYDATSNGVIAANTMIKICDDLTGSEVEIGNTGTILAKGPQMMKGYFHYPEATAKTVDKDGWLHTGDVGYINKDGMVYVIGRKRDMIKYRGNMIAPAELEKVLLQHPAILEAGVIGIPDEEAGELPRAYVVVEKDSLDEEKIMKFVEDRLPAIKHLHGGVGLVDEIPISNEGKISRDKLLKIYEQEL